MAFKPAGLPVQADLTGDMPLMTLLEQYCKQTLLPINRIDRPVSGLVLLAKTKAAAAELNRQFAERTAKKTYLAVVKNLPEAAEGELVHYIKKSSQDKNISKAYPTEQKNAEKGILYYQHCGSSTTYHLLKVNLLTGRHHQIRAQLAAIGSPVKGDVKYGFRRSNDDRSIHLHAWRLSFDHPATGERLNFTAPISATDPVWLAFTDDIAKIV